MGPIRDIPRNRLLNVRKEELRGVSILDFKRSLERLYFVII